MDAHSLIYTQEGITVTGVEKVEIFDAKNVVLKINGGTVELFGNDFVLKDMTAGSGKVIFSGKINSITYKEKTEPSSVWKKLFK